MSRKSDLRAWTSSSSRQEAFYFALKFKKNGHFWQFQALEFNELLLGILLDPHENHWECSWPLWDQKLLKLFHSELQCGRGVGAILNISPNLPHKFTYYACGRGQMAPQRPLEMVKNSGKISGLTEEDEIC